MKTNYLLPHKYKTVGWIFLISGLILGICFYAFNFLEELLITKIFSIYNDPFIGEAGFFKIVDNNIVDEIASLAIILGGLIVGFTKEKVEDEFIYKLRKDSLVWAIIINYIILIITIVFVYDMAFFHVLVFNMFTPLLFFIVRFNFLKLKLNSNEE